MHETLEQILAAYQIHPINQRRISESVYEITDQKRQKYALKCSRLTDDKLKKWLHVYELAATIPLPEVIPVYLHQSEDLYINYQNQIYYITPWLEKAEIDWSKYFQVLANVHVHTKKSTVFPLQQTVKTFNQYESYCRQIQTRLLEWVELFERQHYMSPVELQVCTHYREMNIAIERILTMLSVFIEEINNQHEWSISLCHGNVRREHFVGTNRLHLISWENAYFENAIHDLVHLFSQEATYYDKDFKDWNELFFGSYIQVNPLNKLELLLLIIYLLDMSKYMQTIEQSILHRIDMVVAVQKLQKFYRKIIFGLHFADHVEQQEKS